MTKNRNDIALWPMACIALMITLCARADAQLPEGPPLPNTDTATNATHSVVRIAYYPRTGYYIYQGEYGLTYSAVNIRRVNVYGLIDVDIEALKVYGNFQPNRLEGTFEIGARIPIDKSPIGVFYRHQSTHNIDLSGRTEPSWEQIGLRYQLLRPRYDVSLSAATYDHHSYCHYSSDFDLQGTYRFENSVRFPVSLYYDLHRVNEEGGPRNGFTDYWIQPNLGLTKTFGVFAGYGSTHDVDAANGHSSSSIEVGINWSI